MSLLWIVLPVALLIFLDSVLAQDRSRQCLYSKHEGNFPIQLVSKEGFNFSYGRVEVCAGGFWGTVCSTDEHPFTDNDAEVACYQLGFAGKAVTKSVYRCKLHNDCAPKGSDIWMRNVTCKGTEEYLSNCKYINNTDTCTTEHTDDAMIRCSDTVEYLLQVELLDKTTAEKSGLVIHYYDKEWLPLCFENVNTTDDQLNKTATVICNQLGLGTVKEARYHLTTYSSALNTDATCNGNETFVRLCKKTIWSIGTCKGIAIHVECNGKVPDNLGFYSLSSSSVNLTWEIPKMAKYYSAITSYDVIQESTDKGRKTLTYPALQGDSTPLVTVPDLDPDTEYSFQVAAVYNGVTGPYSQKVLVRTPVNPLVIAVATLGTVFTISAVLVITFCCCIYRPRLVFCWYNKNNQPSCLKRKGFRCPFIKRDPPCCCDPFGRCYGANGGQEGDQRGYGAIGGPEGDQEEHDAVANVGPGRVQN